MAFKLLGEIEWSMETDQEGHRDYTIIWLVETDDPLDGPRLAWECPGLPLEGTPWRFGNDHDPYALCWANNKVKPRLTKTKNSWFDIEQFFSTRPMPYKIYGEGGGPLTTPYDNPPKIRGNFNKHTEEAWSDRFGQPIMNAAFERIGGKPVEFDRGEPSVSITQNILGKTVKNYSEYMDCLNDRPLWGWEKRFIKLSNVTFEKMYYGSSALKVVTLDFDISALTDENGDLYSGFDRYVLDRGYKVLSSDPGADPFNPAHYVSNTNLIDKEKSMTIYGYEGPDNDGGYSKRGRAWDFMKDPLNPGWVHVEKYNEKNFFDITNVIDIDN